MQTCPRLESCLPFPPFLLSQKEPFPLENTLSEETDNPEREFMTAQVMEVFSVIEVGQHD